MTSPAKRRQQRLARKRRAAQFEARLARKIDAERNRWETQILAEWQKEPDDLIDVSPPGRVKLLTAYQ